MNLSRNSGFLAAREAVRGPPLLCCTRLCVSATFALGNLVLRAAPQTQEVHGRLARRQNIERQTVCLLRDGLLACPLVRFAASGGDPGHGTATRQ